MSKEPMTKYYFKSKNLSLFKYKGGCWFVEYFGHCCAAKYISMAFLRSVSVKHNIKFLKGVLFWD